MTRTQLENRYLDLTRVVLPSLGRTRHWPITEDHCFRRVVLDHVFADCWYNHLDRRLRAYRSLNDTQLAQAVAVAERMALADVDTVRQMNEQSLTWRERQHPGTVKHHPPLPVRA